VRRVARDDGEVGLRVYLGATVVVAQATGGVHIEFAASCSTARASS
jgi:hypothetical protein